jgi:hypothetical protein
MVPAQQWIRRLRLPFRAWILAALLGGVLIAGPLAASPQGEFVADGSTVLLWHLNEGSGTAASDASGHARDGAIVGAGWASGRFGQGLVFDGGSAGSQYVARSDSDALTPATATIDVWIRPSRLDLDNQMILHKYQNGAPSNSDYLLLLSNAQLWFGTRGSETLRATLPAVDTWYKITAVANGADSQLYIDDVLVASGFLSPIPNGTQPLVVGSCLSSCASNNHSFAGVIDELRITAGPSTPPPPTDTLLLWHLDEGFGSTAGDSSGHDRNGAIFSPEWTAGVCGSGLLFDGGPTASQYVFLEDSSALTPSAATIDVWIQASSVSVDNQMIVHKYQNNVPANSDYLLELVNDELWFSTQGINTPSQPVLKATGIVTNRWYHITAIADGPHSQLYVDGILRDSGALPPIPNGTAPLILGSCHSACEVNNRSFAGVIDELRLWSGSVPPATDIDLDGVVDFQDNCLCLANPEQTDTDLDGVGDDCDDDIDGDGTENGLDNCPFVPNLDQADLDQDGLGDACDEDPDGDGVVTDDSCPMAPNADQTDSDSDGMGDACDPDDDNDTVCDTADSGGGCTGGPDNCVTTPNSDQADLDNDGIGSACDADIDGDGVDNDTDNCATQPNADQNDADGDGPGDACDPDDDNDGLPDGADNCSFMANSDQSDVDQDGVGDVCDPDVDGDGVPTSDDNCPHTANSDQWDLDGDGLGDACDPDIDGDDVPNHEDRCPGTPSGTTVNPDTGCTIAQLCPCTSQRGTTTPWKNHGGYVSCVAHAANEFLVGGLITQAEKDAIVSSSAQSSCGAN